MQMVRMVTTAEHQYAGRRLRAGDEYDCESIHVPLMKQHGWSRPQEPQGERAADYDTRALATDETVKEKSQSRGSYNRRDMKAAH